MTRQKFDEVMIVNPSGRGSDGRQGVRLMQFHYAEPPDLGYYGEPAEAYGYYAEPPEMGYYAEPPEMGYYGESPDMAYYAEPPEMGYYAEAPEVGYYGESPEMGYYGEDPSMGAYAAPYGYFAEDPMGYYGDGYAGYPMGYYGEEQPVAGYGETYVPGSVGESDPMGYYGHVPEMVGYGEPDMSGYVRDVQPAFNAGCPDPTNVAGFCGAGPLEGYVRPADVSPTCTQFTPPPGATASTPDTFRPLW